MDKEGLFGDFETATHQQWKEKIISDLKGKNFEQTLVWKDENGINHQPIYSANNSKNKELVAVINAAQKQTKNWESIQLFDAKSSSIEKEVANGLANGLDFVFIVDSNNYSQFSTEDIEKNKIFFYVNTFDINNLPHHFLCDPIGEVLKVNLSVKTNLDKLPEVFQHQKDNSNLKEFLLVDGSIYKNGGATIIQELAYTLQHTVEYFDLLTEAGFKPKEIAECLFFKLGFGTSYFSEIAKGRAFQYLIQKVFQEYNVEHRPKVWGEASMYYHAHKDAYSNLLRSTSQTMSMVLGNCNWVSTPTFDQMENSSTLGKRMAKNIPLILKEESFFEEVADAASGSYYIEELSAEIAEKAWNLFIELEKEGTLLQHFISGKLNDTLQKSHIERLESYQNKERTLLGVNKHPNTLSKDLVVKNQNTNGIPSRILSTEIEA